MGKGSKNATDPVEEVEGQLAEASIEDNESGSEGEGEEEEGEEMELTGNMLRRVVMLKQLQEQEDKITEEYKKERCLLEAKYNIQREPLYDQRVGVINGETTPVAVSEEDKVDENEDEEDVGLPGFWLQALANHQVTGEMITEEDVDALESIQDVRCEYYI